MLSCPALPCSCTCMHHIAVPLAAARTILLWPSWRHAPMSLCPSWLDARCSHGLRGGTHQHHHAPHSCMHLAAMPLAAACCCGPRGCTKHVAMALAAAQSTSPWPSWLHKAHRRGPHGCMQHIAMALMTAHSSLPWPSQLHAPCHCGPYGGTHHIAVTFTTAHTTSPWPSSR